jgi:hypothetical protein
MNNNQIDLPEKIELDLNNPIFVFYIKTAGLSKQAAQESIYRMYKEFSIYKNITFWIVPVDSETRIELIWGGSNREKNDELSRLVTVINSRIDVLSKSKSFEDFKINIRDFRIDSLIDE